MSDLILKFPAPTIVEEQVPVSFRTPIGEFQNRSDAEQAIRMLNVIIENPKFHEVFDLEFSVLRIMAEGMFVQFDIDVPYKHTYVDGLAHFFFKFRIMSGYKPEDFKPQALPASDTRTIYRHHPATMEFNSKEALMKHWLDVCLHNNNYEVLSHE